MNRSLIAVTLTAAALLAGCAAKPALPTLYDFGPLPAPAAAGPARAPAPAALVVLDATGPAWLDSTRMYYRLLYADAQQSRPYAHNHWHATPLQLLSERLKSRLAQNGLKVLSGADSTVGMPLLRIEVEDFSQNFDARDSSSVRLALRASVFRAHHLLDQRSFGRDLRAASADAAGGARALAQATDAVTADIIGWLAALPPE